MPALARCSRASGSIRANFFPSMEAILTTLQKQPLDLLDAGGQV
jgi:hypothetical protein